MFFGSVGLSVCLFVDNITQKVMNSLHAVDDPVCICSNQIENCEHFFFHCYLYATQRVAFIARLREICSVDITTNLLLFGSNELDSDVNCQIFELVESYIYESGRFVI